MRRDATMLAAPLGRPVGPGEAWEVSRTWSGEVEGVGAGLAPAICSRTPTRPHVPSRGQPKASTTPGASPPRSFSGWEACRSTLSLALRPRLCYPPEIPKSLKSPPRLFVFGTSNKVRNLLCKPIRKIEFFFKSFKPKPCSIRIAFQKPFLTTGVDDEVTCCKIYTKLLHQAIKPCTCLRT